MNFLQIIEVLPESVKERALIAAGKIGFDAIKRSRAEKKRSKQDEQKIRDKINEKVGETLAQMAIEDVDYIKEKFVAITGREYRKQDNVEAVAAQFAEQLMLPPASGEAPPSDSGKTSDDWFNMFSRYAEDASSEQLQHLLGRVLSGEIKRPGSYSPSTIRALAELDAQDAEWLKMLTQHNLGEDIFINDAWNSGALYSLAQKAFSAGYLSNTPGMTTRNVKIPESGHIFVANHQNAVLFVTGAPGTELSTPVLNFTKVGFQLISLLEQTDPVPKLKTLAELLNVKAKADYCDIRVRREDGLYYPIYLIFHKQAQTPVNSTNS